MFIEVEVSMTTKTGEAIIAEPVNNDSGGNYTVFFTPRTPGDYMILIVADGKLAVPTSKEVCVLLECFVDTISLVILITSTYSKLMC